MSPLGNFKVCLILLKPIKFTDEVEVGSYFLSNIEVVEWLSYFECSLGVSLFLGLSVLTMLVIFCGRRAETVQIL